QGLAKWVVLALVALQERPVGQEEQCIEHSGGIWRRLKGDLRGNPVVWSLAILRRLPALVRRVAALVRRFAPNGRQVKQRARPGWRLSTGGQLDRPGLVVARGIQFPGQERLNCMQIVRGG